jgi:small subunit ribosomal protein S4
MTKRIQARHKIDRRLGVNLWGRPKSPLNTRNYGPGQHGPAKRRKVSDYGVQLNAKQKLKGYYGDITEKQFRRTYKEAVRRRGDTAESLIELLERRLDAVVYRMRIAPTIFAARQLVNHGHIKVGGRRVTIPSYSVTDGEIIELREKSHEIPMILESLQSSERDTPDYIALEDKGMKATFIRAPKLIDVPYPVQMEPNLVVEFYSR